MILKHVIPKLEATFPGQFQVDRTVIFFPEKHPAVGGVEVHDEMEELSVHVGRFTHLHFSNYDRSLSEEQAAERIADDALAFLTKLFADQVVMWGSQAGRGGCYERENGPGSILSFNRGQEYVWSGPISTQG